MKIEIARVDDRMAPSGKAILRSLQNESMPIVDLVVRESFQNSLDATIEGARETKIAVNTNTVKTSEISKYFEKIQYRLEAKFPNSHTVLSISDKNTYGLTGEYNTTNKKALSESNIYKLIYGLNMNQEKDGAGGSWGLGKTSFFRIGCGIVIYYTRIRKEDGAYEERLAACLVEDSGDDKAIMPDNDRGIAWWGSKEDGKSEYDKSFPVINSKIIHEFLNKLKFTPYEGEETGTSIIIPFVTEEDVITNEQEYSEGNAYWWERDLADSVNMAIKRWYGPRIMNKEYSNRFGNSVLIPTVNGNIISPLNFEDTYDWFYRLYSSGLVGKSLEEKITVKPIFLKSLGMSNTREPVGNLAYMKVSTEDLKKNGNSSSLTPLAYIGDKTHLENSATSAKILAYSRKPGMIVQYVIDDANWMKGLNVEENTFVLAYFVPNSEGELHSMYNERYATLENYLRDTENADHAVWIDKIIGAKSITIVERIKREISKALYEGLSDEDLTTSNSKTAALSRKFGSQLLPKANFGKSSSIKNNNSTNTNTSTSTKNLVSTIKIDNFELLSNSSVNINFSATISKDSKVFFEVSTVEKKLNESIWNKSFQGKIEFPFAINRIKINKVNDYIYDDSAQEKEVEVIKNSDMISEFDLKLNNQEIITLEGQLELGISDVTLQPSLSIRQISKKEDE
ncbi:hypothetical protein VXN63_11760 [Marinilactibacillus sp. XAAS-LB27]|uniref:hypothetical protein n=1 Tax=Marinilactibacillus sp. XAAS-LB27 TaxID=3114538 RepID=UPI002E17E506|nr:hypothetical protein [Marinilactibacillus sp. XAAS-LB27]